MHKVKKIHSLCPHSSPLPILHSNISNACARKLYLSTLKIPGLMFRIMMLDCIFCFMSSAYYKFRLTYFQSNFCPIGGFRGIKGVRTPFLPEIFLFLCYISQIMSLFRSPPLKKIMDLPASPVKMAASRNA